MAQLNKYYVKFADKRRVDRTIMEESREKATEYIKNKYGPGFAIYDTDPNTLK